MEALSTLVLRATACNMVLLSKLNNYRAADDEDIKLTLHTGIACGEVCGLYVGGVHGMWEFYVAGDPIKEMSDAAEEAQSGEVVLSAKAYALIADKVDGMQRGGAHGCVQVLQIRTTPPVHPFIVPPVTPASELAANAFIPPVHSLALSPPSRAPLPTATRLPCPACVLISSHLI
jgi:class 3 adenylate cyclase